MNKDLVFQQIAAYGPMSIYGLDKEGKVWQYFSNEFGWKLMQMKAFKEDVAFVPTDTK